jgi:hypothetical protein
MTLSDYCHQLGWDATELSRQARINDRTARKALHGEAITGRVAREIAEALSKALGKHLTAGSIDGLNIKE